MTSEFCTVTMSAIVDTQVMFYTCSVCKSLRSLFILRSRQPSCCDFKLYPSVTALRICTFKN